MKLTDIKIENFRGIRSLHLSLDKLTVLIGENNVGKSTVLEAIRLVLTRGFGGRRDTRFMEYDFHLANDVAIPQMAEPISITLHFKEQKKDEWTDAITQQMNEVIQLDSDGLSNIWLQTRGTFQTDLGMFETKWLFLNEGGIELLLKNSTPLNLISRLVPLFFLSALRDVSQEFGSRGQFWSGFLKSIQLSEEQREEVEKMLTEVNNAVIGANAGLAEVISKIADTNHLVPLADADPVVLEAIPTRVFDMVGKIQVHLKSQYGVKLPLNRHGEGTQNLAVLMLFQAFAATNLTETYTPESTPILALEEPEAHLHPSAVRSLGSFLQNMTGQILVASHSGDLVSQIPVTALRRLYKHNGETKIGQAPIGLLTDIELQAIDYNIRLTKGYYLFSRGWLLVEGASDFHLMPLLMGVMGHSQDQISISVLEISQVIDKGQPFMKLANALGIPWLLMTDGDNAGNDYKARTNQYTKQGFSEAVLLTNKNIEHEFWHNGFDDFIKNKVPDNRKKQIVHQAAGDQAEEARLMIKAAIDVAGGKPAFAHVLANEVRNRGASTIPQSLQNVINSVIKLTTENNV